MGLVDYLDSETSDIDDAPAPPPPPPPHSKQQSAKAAFHKVTDPSEPRKIKVELPAVQPEASEQDDCRPAKKARTAGTFSGFNSMLPAPKRAAVQSAPKAGVSLKTSSEAAFNRAAPQKQMDDPGEEESWIAQQDAAAPEMKVEEPKIVGKVTKFKPLSVANHRKKKPVRKKSLSSAEDTNGIDTKQPTGQTTESVKQAPDPPPPKPRRALFSVPQEDDRLQPIPDGAYEPLINEQPATKTELADPTSSHITATLPAANPNSLQSLTADLNLSPAQQRQLFGRHAKSNDINIAHFNMENEYAANEQLRQAGEVVEHRAVKAIAPGKHSLQQLVNNARSQQEAMEDKWAEGRRERGEGGAKYGWAK